MLDEVFLSKLPPKESSFIREVSRSFQGTSSTYALLNQITQVFADKNYGLQEALLEGCCYRYPSEIKNQRFCGEEAFKNWLLARSHGLPAVYVSTTDFKGRAMPHDIVIVPQKNKLWMLDWQTCTPVKNQCYRLLSEEGNLLAANPHYISEESVFSDCEIFRRKESWLSIMHKPQLLSRNRISTGEIESFVQYHPGENATVFTHMLTDFALEMSCFYQKTISFSRKNSSVSHFSVAVGLSPEYPQSVHPLLPCASTNRSDFHADWLANLTPEHQNVLWCGSLYHLARLENNSPLLLKSEERALFLEDLKHTSTDASASDTSRENAGAQGGFYHSLQKSWSQEAADTYLDVTGFKSLYKPSRPSALKKKLCKYFPEILEAKFREYLDHQTLRKVEQKIEKLVLDSIKD